MKQIIEAAGAGVLAAVALAGGPAAAQSPMPGLRIEHAAARVIVIPEARGNVSVTVQGGDARLPRPQVRTEGGVIVVDGGLERRIDGCGTVGVALGGANREQSQRVNIRGIGPLALDRLPVITARVPLNASVYAGDAVFGEVGPAESLSFGNKGCGDWRLGDVRGSLAVGAVGSGDVRGGRAGQTTVSIAGSGDVFLTDVAGLEAHVAGSGDIKVGRVNGPLSARVAGSGDITVDGGRAPNVAANIAGSGDIRFGGEAGAVAARIAGSGDVRVAHASGPVSRTVAGSGDVMVGR